MLRPILPLASCGSGSGPINPLGLLSAFVPGIEHLSGGYDQCLESTQKSLMHCTFWHHGNRSSLGLVLSATEQQCSEVRSGFI